MKSGMSKHRKIGVSVALAYTTVRNWECAFHEDTRQVYIAVNTSHFSFWKISSVKNQADILKDGGHSDWL